MADPPPIRRPAFIPPPIPPLRAPTTASMATPSPAASSSGDEDTSSVEASGAGAPLEHVLARASSEPNDGALAVRCALARWDALNDRDEAMRLLARAGAHPLALRMRLADALPDEVALEAFERDVASPLPVELELDLAEAWTWRHRRFDRAVDAVERLHRRELPSALANHVRELAVALYMHTEAWTKLVELRRRALGESSHPEEVAAVAALLLDRAGDAAGALAACWTKLAHYAGDDTDALGWLRVFDVAIDAASVLDDARRFELLDKRAEHVAALPGGALEALATRHAIASELERDGQPAEAAGLWARLAEEPVAGDPLAARTIALLRAAWAAAAAGAEPVNRGAALVAHQALSRTECATLATAHAWRALELAAALHEPALLQLAPTIADASDTAEGARWLDSLELATPTAATMARLERRSPLAVRWAATIAECRGERRAARALWQRASAHDHDLRLARGEDEDALAEAYRTAAGAAPDAATAAILWCARGAIELASGGLGDAEQSLQRAADLEPDDAFARIALAVVREQRAAVDRTGDAMTTTAPVERVEEPALVEPPEVRVATLERELRTVDPADEARQIAILLELAELRATKLGRLPEAVNAYESVLDRVGEHPVAIAALERLYEQLGRDRELIRILEMRAETEADAVTRGKLYARIGTLRDARDDIQGALAMFGKAFAADPTNRDTFTAMERVAYRAERWDIALQLYADTIAHVESAQSRAYRLGDLYARRGNVQLNYLGQIELAIGSYQKVVEVDSQPAGAVKILEDICTTRGNWQYLIAAYEKRAETQRDPQRKADALEAAAHIARERAGDARQSVRLNRKLLALDPSNTSAAASLEAYYEESQDRTGLVDMLKLRLGGAANEDEAVALLKKIARASEDGARDVVTATEHYKKILELQPRDREALEALARIYESTEQWAELVEVTRKLIEVTNDRNTKALLYFRCGSVIEAKFGRELDAIRYYDKAIRVSSACLPAVHGLRDLYRRREEWPRVIETLELEVKLWQDDKERAGVFAQIGRVHAQHLGDLERALTFYETAVQTDPECVPANEALFDHHFERGDWDKAHQFAEQLYEKKKSSREGDPQARSEFFRKVGIVARELGDPTQAAEDFISAIEVRTANAAALDDLGALARAAPDALDFEATYRELEKVYRKRDDGAPLLARVLVGQAAILERAGDLDQASALYEEAAALAPGELAVISPLVDFHVDNRHFDQAVDALARFVAIPSTTLEDRRAALLRRAEIHGDGEMDPVRAIGVLHEVLALDPLHQDTYYQLAQQYFLLGDYGNAHAAIDRVIELATAPSDAPLIASALARYYYYKGRILDEAGEARAAAPQYRRAIEYDPGYAPPALVLARRAAEAGDQRQAETLLIDAAHAAMAQGGPRAAVPLQRGLARILLASGDRPAAIEAYRGILNVEPDGASDRVALAEIYAVDDTRRAIGELRKVLERDIHHAPAYRLLASYLAHEGDLDRAYRVLMALDLLGFAEDADRAMLPRLRHSRSQLLPRRSVDAAYRERYLLTPAAREPLAEVFTTFAEELTAIVTQPSLGQNLLPAHDDPRLAALAHEIGGLYEADAEIFVADNVPSHIAVTAYPRRLLVIDRSLLAEPDAGLRFLFGYAFEAIRGGYATLLQVGARKRKELAALLRALLSADLDAAGAADLINNATPEQAQVLEHHAGTLVDPAAWMDGMLALAKRAGLLACDDFPAAICMVARLAGERLETDDATVALGAALGGADLVRFYLSDDYQHLCLHVRDLR